MGITYIHNIVHSEQFGSVLLFINNKYENDNCPVSVKQRMHREHVRSTVYSLTAAGRTSRGADQRAIPETKFNILWAKPWTERHNKLQQDADV